MNFQIENAQCEEYVYTYPFERIIKIVHKNLDVHLVALLTKAQRKGFVEVKVFCRTSP